MLSVVPTVYCSAMDPITDEQILNDIIERLSQGVVPWRRPWSESAKVVVIGSMKYSATMWPSNLRAPKVPFGVFNGTMLLAWASKQEYRSNLWIAEAVIEDLGADLIKDDEQPVAIQRFVDKYSPYYRSQSGVRRVYNVDQVKDCERALGLTFLEKQPPAQKERYKRSEELLKELTSRYALRIEQQNIAAYSPSWDLVMMPDVDQFKVKDGVAHYWATLWHEVAHWTGHHSRLNRDRHRKWGDKTYAFEELIAELGAAFLCAHLEIDGEVQHESYLNSWCSALKEDRASSLWAAAAYATEAKEFVLAREDTSSSQRPIEH